MRPNLPTITSLRVFEAAARHLSFTTAADELFLTQSAVSKQIRALEECLDVPLFIRVNRGLAMTALGSAYLDDIRPVLDQLVAASARLTERRTAPSTLTLRMLAILGDRWLLPRFGSFARQYPQISVQFTSLMSKDGREHADADGEFRFGDGNWHGYQSDYLFGREMLLVASEHLLAQNDGLQQLSDVAKFPLLQHFQAPQAWTEFFADNRVLPPQNPRVIRYEFYSTLLRSAAAGMGVALVPSELVQEELSRGDLINPLTAGYTSRNGYYFVFHEHQRANPTLAALRSWLQLQAQETRGEQVDEIVGR